MIKFIKHIVVILSLLVSISCFGQINEVPWQGVSPASNMLREKLSGQIFHYEYSTSGSQFYHHDFYPAKITLENGEVIDSVMSRYNSFYDELVCFNPNLRCLFTIDKFKVKQFEIPTVFGIQKFIKLESDKFRADERFFHVVFQGNILVLAFYKTEFEKTGLYRDKYGSLKDSELIQSETYYIYSPENGLKKFIPARSSFYSLYSDNKKQVRKILRRNKFYRFNINSLNTVFRLIEEAGIAQ